MFKKILILAPHTDDEISCGSSITKLLEEGKEVHYLAFSTARASVKPEFPKNILETEVKEATKILGIPPENLTILDYPVRHFPKHRQEILEDLIKIRENIKPDLIFLPSLNDIHQDHQVIAQEGLRAFKQHTLLGYEKPWNNMVSETRCFIPLEEKHIKNKVEALNCYQSQKHRPQASPDLVWSLARIRGNRIEKKYAESFEIMRLIL